MDGGPDADEQGGNTPIDNLGHRSMGLIVNGECRKFKCLVLAKHLSGRQKARKKKNSRLSATQLELVADSLAEPYLTPLF
jgi:hypothetical protein